MTKDEYKAHRADVMRNPGAMVECLTAHGVAEDEIPTNRSQRISLHGKAHPEPQDSEPAQDEKPAEDPQPEPAKDEKPAARTRTRKTAPKPKPEPKPEPPAQTGSPELGVPYAKLETRGRNLVATCPECSRTFIEKADKNGEQTTDNYAQHYASEHKAQDEPKPKPARKPAAKPAPAKPARSAAKPAKGTKPAARASAKPAPAKAAANGTSPRVHKQELARELVTFVAEHFASRSYEDRERISYWLRGMPTGNPDLPGTVGGVLRWWPSQLPRPDGPDWNADWVPAGR
jgi:hypothetical protein